MHRFFSCKEMFESLTFTRLAKKSDYKSYVICQKIFIKKHPGCLSLNCIFLKHQMKLPILVGNCPAAGPMLQV